MRQAENDWLDNLAEDVADGRILDWDALESSTDDERRRTIIRRLRAVAEVARAHSELTFSDSVSDSLSVRSQLPGFDDPSIPTHWGPLRILERVGRGRFGDVYRAWDPSLDREVALKLLRRRHVDPQSTDREVVEEGRLMARVRHPNVVTIYGAQRIDGRTGLWMEFIEGGRTLESELADRGPFSESDIVAVGSQLCQALAAVHDAGLVHRDVKASNVMRDRGERVVLGDFGTGHELAEPQGQPGLAGTPTYIAPEVLRGEAATCQSDIYSLGVLLFHLATGVYPVNGRTMHELREAHARRDSPSLPALRPDLNERLVSTIERALNPQRSLRFDRAVDLDVALCRRRPDPGERRRTFITIGSALTLTTAIVALGYFGVRLWSSQSDIPRVSSMLPSDASAAAPRLLTDPPVFPAGPASPVTLETASSPKPSGPMRGSQSDLRSGVLPFGDLRDHVAAADAFLREGDVVRARRQAAMIPESDLEAVIGTDWKLGFEARAAWLELDAVAALKATDALHARGMGPLAAQMYISLGRLKQAEAVASELPPPREALPATLTRDWMLVSTLRLASDPAPLRDLLLSRPRPTIVRNDLLELLIHAGLLDEAEGELRSLRERIAGKVVTNIESISEADILLKRGGDPRRAIEIMQDVRIPVAPFAWSNAYLARTRAHAWETLGDINQAIEALKAVDVPRHVIGGSSYAGIWLNHRGLMARLYRLAGRNDEAAVMEEELRKLLTVADADHPVLRGLKSQEPASQQK